MSKYRSNLDLKSLVALDFHTHAHVPSRSTRDPCVVQMEEAMSAYFNLP